MFCNKNRSPLCSTKTATPNILPRNLLQQSLDRISLRYSTSEAYYVIHNINLAIQNKKCRLKTILKDQQFDKEEEILQKYYKNQSVTNQITELTQYYKYYTQTSILYQQKYFKLMHQHREKKKIVEYNKLKVLLNLSDTTNQEITPRNKNNVTPNSVSNILSKLNTSFNFQDGQSIMILKLKNKMERQMGPNCHKSIEELDRNYHFQKKNMENYSLMDYQTFKKVKINKKEKQTFRKQQRSSKNVLRGKRNNSCESLNSLNSKRIQVKNGRFLKRKHQSMDNFEEITKQMTKEKQPKVKLLGNWTQPKDNINQKRKERTINEKLKDRNQTQKIKQNQGERISEIRQKILDFKQRIKQEKQLLRRKATVSTNQSEIYKNSKKGTILTSTNQKYGAKKIGKTPVWN